MEKEQPKFKILMFPWLAHGHIYPFLELAKRLSKRNFTIYICSTPINLDSIESTIEKHSSNINTNASIELVQLHVPSSPQLPPELHTTKNLPSNLLFNLINAFQMSFTSFSSILDSLKPDLLIYDLFQPWAPKLASSKSIPSVFFSVSGATSYAYYHHVHTMGAYSPFPYESIYLREHKWIEMVNFITPYIKDADGQDFAFGNFTLSNDIILASGSREVEEKYIDYLSVLSKKRIVPTSPLIARPGDDYYDDDDDEETSKIMKWLSMKNPCSTIYISFGSEFFSTKGQIAEIAKGLVLSNVNFLWVIRFPLGEEATSIEEKLPVGFVETVKDRGMVITRWAPQGKILRHPSIGGFVSHCGWNSMMESLYFGVPIIAVPMQLEQPLTAQMVVESGVGVEVEKDGSGDYLGKDLAKAINKVIVEKEFYEGLRDRAKRLSEKIKETEETEMNEAAQELMRICMKNKK